MCDSKMDLTIEEFCKKLPKIELHAHLNGSISEETMQKLIERKRASSANCEKVTQVPESWQTVITKDRQTTIEERFAIFGAIHSLVDSEEAVMLVTEDVVKEFAEDGVVYLELRTTPKSYPQNGMTKYMYIGAVLKGIEQACTVYPIEVRLLLSIDRSRSVQDAMDTVDAAVKWRDQWQKRQGRIVGMDFSGKPSLTDVAPFMPALRKAKDAGMKLSLHISEIPGNTDTEELLSLNPDRIGHGTFLHPENGGKQSSIDFIIHNKIPIELCMTSNVKCRTVDKYENHHFGFWYRKHLLILCTDDKGVFSTSLSKEYEIAAKTFQLSHEDLRELCIDSIDAVFDESVQKQLRNIMMQCA